METAPKDGTGAMARRTLAVTLVVVTLAAVFAGIAALTGGAALARHSGTPASGYGATATPFATITLKCGTSTTPNCPTAPPDPSLEWITIPADTPANVLTAFQLSSIYLLSQNGSGDGRLDLSRPETPVFVRELHAPGGLVLPDVWVISFDGSDGMMGYIAICDINDAHTALRCGPALALVLLAVTTMLGLTLLGRCSGLFRFGPLHVDDLALTLGAAVLVLVVLEVLKLLSAGWRQSQSQHADVSDRPR